MSLPASTLRALVKPGCALAGWRVVEWFAHAEEDLKDLALDVKDDDKRTIILSTDGLGAGKTFIPYRTVISTCQSNRKIGEIMMGNVPNSKQGVIQEGGRVARADFLGPGRHILLRQFESLPESHSPEIQTSPLHKTALRLVRDGFHASALRSEAWLPGEAPQERRLQAAYEILELRGCVQREVGGRLALTGYGRTILKLPINCSYAEVILAAKGKGFFDTVLAGVSFLEAAEGVHLIAQKDVSHSSAYRLCGTRVAGVQDDFLRFARLTMLASDFHGYLQPLVTMFNVPKSVLKRAAEVYWKLHVLFNYPQKDSWSSALVTSIRTAIRGNKNGSDVDVNASIGNPTPSGDGSCAGVQIAEIFRTVLPDHVGVKMKGGCVFQLGTGIQVVCKSVCEEVAIPLLYRGNKWMGLIFVI